MKDIQAMADKTAIGLSALCTLHCLALPFLLVLLPVTAAWNLQDEAFHLWLLLAVVPTSAYALTVGCRKHGRYSVMLPGVLGLCVLLGGAWFGHELLGEQAEKVLSVCGALLVAVGHMWNHKLCRGAGCECHV